METDFITREALFAVYADFKGLGMLFDLNARRPAEIAIRETAVTKSQRVHGMMAFVVSGTVIHESPDASTLRSH